MRSYRMTSLAGSRAYYLHTPKGVRRSTRVPLVVALHGCDQDAREFAEGTRFNAVADRNGFAVVYPEQSRFANGQRCWSWFRPEHQSRHRGEPAVIAGIVQRLLAERTLWRIDPSRVYVTGLSAGGGMAMVLAATYPDLFAAVGVHSGPPYRAATRPARAVAAMQGQVMPPPPPSVTDVAMPPLVVFQGTRDLTVRRTNARRLADQWLHWYDDGQAAGEAGTGPGTRRTGAAPVGPVGAVQTRRKPAAAPFSGRGTRGYTVSTWSVGRRRVLEVWEVDGLGHAWCGGSGQSSYCDPRGPRASTEMWRFFTRHTLSAAVPARPSRAGSLRTRVG